MGPSSYGVTSVSLVSSEDGKAYHMLRRNPFLIWFSFLPLGQCLSRKTFWSSHPPFPASPCALSGALFLERGLQTTKAAAVNVSV